MIPIIFENIIFITDWKYVIYKMLKHFFLKKYFLINNYYTVNVFTYHIYGKNNLGITVKNSSIEESD